MTINNVGKRLFLPIFCTASIIQGMYSTYFVSTLTTLERVYQIPSKTAGAILSASEIGQIIGSLLIAYHGGRGNKPKWISACMTITALAALISISPQLLLLQQGASSATTTTTTLARSYQSDLGAYDSHSRLTASDDHVSPTTTTTTTASPLSSETRSSSRSSVSNSSSLPWFAGKINAPKPEHLCYYTSVASSNRSGAPEWASAGNGLLAAPRSEQADPAEAPWTSSGAVLVIFFLCLMAIGFGSTAITTLGIPFIDDIVSKEESPLYLGLTIGLRIFGPALGFLLGSFCARYDLTSGLAARPASETLPQQQQQQYSEANLTGDSADQGTWWLGLIIISVPLLVLALPMYLLSRYSGAELSRQLDDEDDFDEDAGVGEITYQAAEDHDIGGSRDFNAAHVLTIGDIDVTSNKTLCSDMIDSSSREILQQASSHADSALVRNFHYNFGQNLTLEKPILSLHGHHHHNSYLGADNLDEPTQSLAKLHRKPTKPEPDGDTCWTRNCLIVNHFGGLESTSFVHKEVDGQLLAVAAAGCTDHEGAGKLARSSTPSASSSSSSSSSSAAAAAAAAAASSSSTSSIMGAIRAASIAPSPTPSSSSMSASQSKQQHKQHKQHKPLANLTSGANNSNNNNGRRNNDLSATLKRLINNRLLLLRIMSSILHILPIAGFYTFLPKYLIQQYHIVGSSASAISGLAGILFVGLGAFIGGTIMRIWSVNSRLMTKWIAGSALLYSLGMLLLMNLGCDSSQMVRLDSIRAQLELPASLAAPPLDYECVARKCNCSRQAFMPVCARGLTLESPCLAGCRSFRRNRHDEIVFQDCDCLRAAPQGPQRLELQQQQQQDNNNSSSQAGRKLDDVTQGRCSWKQSNCDNLKWYIIVFSLFTLAHSSCEVGSMMFNLRCVRSNERALALGLITFCCSLFGTIPCSILYGSIIDLTCVRWDGQQGGSAGPRGACLAYDNQAFRVYLHAGTSAIMLLAFLVDCVICGHARQVDFYMVGAGRASKDALQVSGCDVESDRDEVDDDEFEDDHDDDHDDEVGHHHHHHHHSHHHSQQRHQDRLDAAAAAAAEPLEHAHCRRLAGRDSGAADHHSQLAAKQL